jgi:hypothetical protein
MESFSPPQTQAEPDYNQNQSAHSRREKALEANEGPRDGAQNHQPSRRNATAYRRVLVVSDQAERGPISELIEHPDKGPQTNRHQEIAYGK